MVAASLILLLTVSSSSRAEALVLRLGGPGYAAREQVGRELVELGRYSLPALRRGQTHADLEIAERCKRLLPLAVAESARQRLARLEALARTDPLPAIPLNERLLRRFVAAAGDTRGARQFYLEIYREHAKTLDDIEWAEPKAAGEAFWGYVDRWLIYPDGRITANLSTLTYNRVDLALFWFLSVDPEVRPAPCPGLGRKDCPYYFPKHASGHLDGPDAIPEMRRLFLTWLTGPRNVPDPEVDRRMAGTGFELALNSRQTDLVAAVQQIAVNRDAPRGTRVEALFAIMRSGGVSDVDRLVPTIADDTIVYLPSPIQGPGRKVVVGDIALAACVRLAGRRLGEFGFPDAPAAEDEPNDLRHYGFSDDDARAAARKRWVAHTAPPGGKP